MIISFNRMPWRKWTWV